MTRTRTSLRSFADAVEIKLAQYRIGRRQVISVGSLLVIAALIVWLQTSVYGGYDYRNQQANQKLKEAASEVGFTPDELMGEANIDCSYREDTALDGGPRRSPCRALVNYRADTSTDRGAAFFAAGWKIEEREPDVYKKVFGYTVCAQLDKIQEQFVMRFYSGGACTMLTIK